MLKNLTVITKRVKEKEIGILKYTQYLVSKKAQSHKDTEIICLSSNSKTDAAVFKHLVDICHEVAEFDLNNKKGGRKVESYGQSFVFSLPKGTEKPTPEQWQGIKKDILIKTVKTLELDDETAKKLLLSCFCVAHNQEAPHLNIIYPRILKKENGEFIRLDKIDKKAFLNSAKKAFNAAALKHLALDFEKYKPENTNTGKSLSSWQKQQQQALAAQKEAALAQEKASKMLQEAAEKQIEAEKMLTEAKNKEIEITNQIRKFDLFKESFNMIFNTIKYYLGNTTKQAKLEDKKMVEEEYKSVSKNPFFEENHKEILQLAAAEVDQEIEEEDEKLSPIFRVKYK